MELIEVNKEEYFKIIGYSYIKFNSMQFNDANKDNADRVCYFLFRDSKYRLGLIAGIKNNVLLSPFSAPFGGFSFRKSEIKIKYIEKALTLLETWAESNAINKFQFTLPPLFYHDTFIAKEVNSFFTAKYDVNKIDLNFHFETSFLNDDYEKNIWYSAKKSLNKSKNKNLIFKKCIDDSEKELAYFIIKINRNERGFPLRMKFYDILKTNEIIKKDFFLVYTEDNKPAAAAIVFQISDKIVQVVYWGDDPKYSHLSVMNFISYKIFQYYKKQEIKFVDIGPSTEDSIPNYGLCEFKESIGCKIFPKYTFIKKIKDSNKYKEKLVS